MKGGSATARAALVTSGSQVTRLFAVTVTGSVVMVGSIASAPFAGGSMRWEGNR
jgi:hypothetical protein